MSRRTGSRGWAPGAGGSRAAPAAASAAALAAIPLAALAALLLAAPAAARAALSVQAGVDRDRIGADETVVLEVRVEADAEPVLSLPARGLEFEVVSRGQSRQTSVDLGGGGGVRIRSTWTYQLVLSPRRTGDLTIPPIQVKAGQASADTVPIRVQVLPAGAAPPPPPPRGSPGAGRGGPFGNPFGNPFGAPGGGRRAWSGWERDLTLQVELDRKEAWLGEQVTASLWLLSPVGVVETGGLQAPMLDGFWSEQLEAPQALAAQVRTIDGVPTRAYLVQRLALFPTRAGELEVGSYQLQLAVRVGSEDPFDPFPDVQRVTRKSKPVTLAVKPLPPGAPPGFDGVNVGTMTLAATLSERAVAVGQPVTLRLTVQGDGNVKAWSPPAPPRVAGLKAFAPTSADALAPQQGRLAGSRTTEVVLVGEQAGAVTIPPVSWPIFDPRTGSYRVLATAPLTLDVLPGGPQAAGSAPRPGGNALGQSLRPLRPAGALSRHGEPPWSGLPFWLLVGAPVALFAVLAGRDRLREHQAAGHGARRVRQAGRVARRRLAAAERLARGAEAGPFYLELERALQGYCGDKLARSTAGLTRQELERALAEAGAHPPAVKSLHAALDACDAGRFGGGGARAEALELAGRAMTLLEEAHWRGEGGDA